MSHLAEHVHAATRPYGLLFALAALGLFGAVLLAPGSTFATDPVVILLSWDGVRYDYPDRAKLPALSRMAQEGVRAERLIPVFPTNTFPNHVALATGTYTDRHGILDNQFRDRERGLFFYNNDANWLEAEPLWVAAERQGVRAAVFFWVGSETDWRGVGASYRKAPFDGTVGEEEKVAQILAWLDLPKNERPGLIMSWWHGTDRVGHQKGPDHPDIITQLEDQDRHLARLFAALDDHGAWEYTTVVVVSDHGMTKVNETVRIEEPLAQAGIKAEVVGETTTKHVFLEDPAMLGKAEAVLRSLAGVTVYRRDALPEHLRIHYPSRNGDLVLVAAPPRIFQQSQTGEALLSWFWGGPQGMHGYTPEHPDMGAIFFALGRGVPQGKQMGAVRVIDVAPTVAKLLGIAPPHHAEGTPIAGLGEKEARRRQICSVSRQLSQPGHSGLIMLYRFLADTVVIAHLSFVLFAVLGGILVLKWKRCAWVHLPAVLWAALVEFTGWVCPLTPLEHWLRAQGGASGYDPGFIEHYILPVLYPTALTRELQVVLGTLVLIVNLSIYAWVAWVLRRNPRRRSAEEGANIPF